jgi:hypothetical protein
MALLVCGQCRRHVKRGESVCPFCGTPQPSGLRRGLGAAVILGAGLAVSGCGSGTDLGGDAGASVDGSSDSDASASDAGVADARDEQPVTLYGPAPTDAAVDVEDGGMVALYAAVPIYSSVPRVE